MSRLVLYQWAAVGGYGLDLAVAGQWSAAKERVVADAFGSVKTDGCLGQRVVVRVTD
jgi:hypothetical protein